ncbi:MAG TPA: hypothetical protein VK168_02040, partial [Saprospiraceae bacterium]|nr:hypothetical protein [Saprospiraceae bacterium]
GQKLVLFPPFFTFFQSRNSGYASSKTQKLTKKAQIFDSGRKSPTCSNVVNEKRKVAFGGLPLTRYQKQPSVFLETKLVQGLTHHFVHWLSAKFLKHGEM